MLRIASIDDPRAASYRNLPERTLRGESLFIAEGKLVALRLLASGYAVESMLVAEEQAAEMERAAAGRAPILVAGAATLREILGFPFHRGVLALGRRREPPPLDDLLTRIRPDGPARLVVLPAVQQAENVGLIFRTAAGLGVDGVVLGPKCSDPLSRRALRLSMGASLSVPFARSDDVARDLRALHERWAVATVAAVPDREAEPLPGFRWPRRAALLLGNEFEGVGADLLGLCDRRVTVPIRPGVDSLNVGVAAGILVYEMMKESGQEERRAQRLPQS